jgi:hypothetical protein
MVNITLIIMKNDKIGDNSLCVYIHKELMIQTDLFNLKS